MRLAGEVRNRHNFPPNRAGDATIAFSLLTVIRYRGAARLQSGRFKLGSSEQRKKGGILMEWVQPDFEEISLACEINSYAAATL